MNKQTNTFFSPICITNFRKKFSQDLLRSSYQIGAVEIVFREVSIKITTSFSIKIALNTRFSDCSSCFALELLRKSKQAGIEYANCLNRITEIRHPWLAEREMTRGKR